jgi:hypothetical protein
MEYLLCPKTRRLGYFFKVYSFILPSPCIHAYGRAAELLERIAQGPTLLLCPTTALWACFAYVP